MSNAPHTVIWGTGSAKREFLHVDDMADACLFLLENYSDFEQINIGSQIECTVMELGHLIADIVDYKGPIHTDPTKPDGTPRKLLDSDRLFAMGWRPRVGLEEGLREAYVDFLQNHVHLRR